MEKITITKNEYWAKVSELAKEAKSDNEVINGYIVATIALFCGELSDKLFAEKEENKKWN